MSKEMIKKIIKPNILLLCPIILIISINLFLNKINLGVEYTSANVVEFTLLDSLAVEEVEKKVYEIKPYSKVESYENNQYTFYYQEVSLEELESLQDDIQSNVGVMSSFQVLIYKPTTLVLIVNRIYYGVYVATVIYIGLLMYIFKNTQLTREKVLSLIMTDLLLIFIQGGVLIGGLNLLGFWNLKLSSTVITVGAGALLIGMLPNILISRKLQPDIIETWQYEASRLMHDRSRLLWLFIVIYAAFAWVYTMNAALFLLISAFLAYSVYLYTYAKPVLLQWNLRGLAANRLIKKNKFLKKEW